MILNTTKINQYYALGLDGQYWYREEAQKIIDLLPEFDGLPIIRAFAVTSMTTSIEANVSLAIKALMQLRDGYAFTGFLPNQIKYLDLIKAGHDVPGRKIMSFIKALEGDNYAVVVDIWMTRAFGTARLRQYDNRKTTLAPTKREYDAIEAYCRLEAIIRGVTPREYQSIIWTGIKRAESPLSRETCWSDLIMKRRGFVSF